MKHWVDSQHYLNEEAMTDESRQFTEKWGQLLGLDVQFLNLFGSQDTAVVNGEPKCLTEDVARNLHADVDALLKGARQVSGDPVTLMRHLSIGYHNSGDTRAARFTRALHDFLDANHAGYGVGVQAQGSTGKDWFKED